MKALFFYTRGHRSDVLTREWFEGKFGRVTIFDPLGIVLSRKQYDLRGLSLFRVTGYHKQFHRIKAPICNSKTLVYYVET